MTKTRVLTRKTLAWIIAAAVLLVAAAPLMVSSFYVTLLSYIGLSSIVALGLVLLTGVGGMTSFGQCSLLARRLVEAGVRYIHINYGAGQVWDDHKDIDKNLRERCPDMDKAAAALIRDLKRRGLLDETLVVWGGEFGRTPVSEKLA